ncbi:uncharacterized protein LOC104908229 [Beta vulgaris subsp. vulgaris]|uniref:uncharacterized protein LOC104908229 n=1 Tax=Beta vulgaris subsp. vulgaris TaxID=3555 RepID=UPI002036BFB2|nr:uncharacterized protein LOC104908229 [Beta vulgaris subsp. vulgaris]
MSSESSYNSNISSSSSSNSDDPNSYTHIQITRNNEYMRRSERRRQTTRLMDQMMERFVMANPAELYAMVTQVPRAPRTVVPRDRDEGHHRLWNDYFAENPVYPPQMFRRRFRMQKHVFLRIEQVLTSKNSFFQQRPDAAGKLGASSLLKCTAAMRLLAYGGAADSVDDYLKISASLARDSLRHFVEGVVAHFGDEYLRKPNEADLRRLLYAAEERGFPGMMGSIDCMHWRWKNCPLQFKGLYSGRPGKPTLVLEAVASYDLWIWHAFFGTPGRCNDINVLDRSPLFNDVFEGRAPAVNYVGNGHQYDMGYYLAYGIYPQWAAFIPTISLPQNEKESLFAQNQESKRKDVERAFGVLQARFAIIRQPALARDKEMLGKIIIACIIIHNMVVEDERDSYSF